MRAIKAKRIRKAVYGKTSIRDRKYASTGTQIISDEKRWKYQHVKKLCR